MIIGHSLQPATWTLSGPGAAFLSPAQMGYRPDRVTAIRWLSGTQTTATVLRLRADWAAPIVPGLVYLAGGDLPVGTKIEVAWKRPTDGSAYPYMPTAYNNPQRVIEGPRGERTCAILVKPGATPIVGCEIRIYNDVNGVPAIPAGATVTAGAIMPLAATDVCVAAGIEISTIDPTVVTYGRSRTPYTVPGVPYRQLNLKLGTADQARWFAEYRPLEARIDRGQPAVYIPRTTTPGGAFDAGLMHDYAMIGIATSLPAMQHVAGKYFASGQLIVDEVPVPV